jgi:hypothetical protein
MTAGTVLAYDTPIVYDYHASFNRNWGRLVKRLGSGKSAVLSTRRSVLEALPRETVEWDILRMHRKSEIGAE